MKTDYKFWYIKRDDDVHISECAVRFYEGEYVTEDGKEVYRRGLLIDPDDVPERKKNPVKLDFKGEPTIVYTDKDFGVITSNDELRVFLNGELAKDKKRQPTDAQTGNSTK